MYFTYVEKQNSSFFGGWSVREVAFDVTRRYLYYSEDPVPENLIAPPNRFKPDSQAEEPGSSRGDGSSSRGADAMTNPSRPPLLFSDPPPPPHPLSALKWKKKIKVDLMIPIGKEHQFILEDPHLKERDLYQVELHGEIRQMAPGEVPPDAPLLCPSAGLSGMPQRMTLKNEEFIRDPDFKRELYESLRVVFTNLRLDLETAAAAAGEDTANIKAHTLESPKTKGFGAARKKILLRFRTDYEYRRFIFVVQTVLGYDKIIARPYRGLPPYDPRNGIIFSQIPMYVWHTFKSLDRAVIYSFVRGDMIGQDGSGEVCPLVKGAFLCVSHDTVFVMRDTGHITRWVSLNRVNRFYFNITGDHPYFALISDPGYPDILFVPQPPFFGTESVQDFSGKLEVLRVHRVIHDTCFASVMERRVIEIVERTKDEGAAEFLKSEEASGYQFQFTPSTLPDGVVSCPLPKEQLGNLWREVQTIFAERDQATLNSAAVPLYENNTNEVPLTREQMEIISQRLNRERGQRDQIVGVSYAQAQRIEEDDDNTDDIYLDRPRGGFSFGVSADGSAFPTSHYITKADLASSHAPAPGEFAVDHHAIMAPMASTPFLNPSSLAPNKEFHLEGMMATSFSAFASSVPAQRAYMEGLAAKIKPKKKQQAERNEDFIMEHPKSRKNGVPEDAITFVTASLSKLLAGNAVDASPICFWPSSNFGININSNKYTLLLLPLTTAANRKADDPLPMYFTIAEKKHGSLFTQWSSRLVVVDCKTSILYYTAASNGEMEDRPFSETLRETPPNDGATFSSCEMLARSKRKERWKAAELLYVIPIARDKDWGSDRQSLLTIDICAKTVQKGQRSVTPPLRNKLLCPSTGPARDYSRLSEDHDEYIDDPFFQKELYENIRDLMVAMRRQHQLEEARRERDAQNSRPQSRSTSQGAVTDGRERFPSVSPHRSRSPAGRSEYNTVITLRFSCEYEYWRFFYVTSSLLGYRGLQRRPYFGFPPYDPRNRVSFAPFPVTFWYRMNWLNGVHHAYAHVFGDLIGTKKKPEKPCVMIESCILSITYDYVFIVNSKGKVAQWVPLNRVHTMYCNSQCHHPYIIFLSDADYPDVIFISRPEAGRRFISDTAETTENTSVNVNEPDATMCGFQIRRVTYIVRKTCFGSTEPRRVISIRESNLPSVTQWMEWWKANHTDSMTRTLTPAVSPTGTPSSRASLAPESVTHTLDLKLGYKRPHYASFPLRRQPLQRTWATLGRTLSEFDYFTIENSAVPLYENCTNTAPLTVEQLELAEELLVPEAEAGEGVVGLSLDNLREVHRCESQRRNSVRDPNMFPDQASDDALMGQATVVFQESESERRRPSWAGQTKPFLKSAILGTLLWRQKIQTQRATVHLLRVILKRLKWMWDECLLKWTVDTQLVCIHSVYVSSHSKATRAHCSSQNKIYIPVRFDRTPIASFSRDILPLPPKKVAAKKPNNNNTNMGYFYNWAFQIILFFSHVSAVQLQCNRNSTCDAPMRDALFTLRLHILCSVVMLSLGFAWCYYNPYDLLPYVVRDHRLKRCKRFLFVLPQQDMAHLNLIFAAILQLHPNEAKIQRGFMRTTSFRKKATTIGQEIQKIYNNDWVEQCVPY
eukprot:gene9702-6799_t